MKPVLVIGVLVGAILLVYSNTLSGKFVYDDQPVIARNPLIRSLRRIPLLFGSPYWGMNIGQPKEFKGSLYRPLTMATFSLDYFASGLDPLGYHLTNLIFHLGVTLLLWILCLRLGLTPPAAAAAALIFTVLPIHTEAVSNVVGRSEVLAAFFTLLSWNFVTGRPSMPRVFLGTLCYVLALLSKENAAAFLGVLIATDIVINRKSWKTLLHERLLIWVTYLGGLLLYFEWRDLILGRVLSMGGTPYFKAQSGLVIGLSMSKFFVVHYFAPLLTGIGLCAEYTRPSLPDATFQDPMGWLCAFLLLGGFGYAAFAAFARKNARAVGALIFFIFLLPVCNLIVPLEVIGAERFLYLPSIGYSIILGVFFGQWIATGKQTRNLWAAAILAVLCAWYGWQTFQRNRAWRTEESFWATTLRDAPRSPRAWNGEGILLMGHGRYDDAIGCFNKALGLNPMLLDAHYNMATCFFRKGNYRVAKRGYEYIARQKPYDPDTLFHLAYIAESERDFKSAARYYATILTVNPLDENAQRSFARMKGTMQRAGGG